MRLQRILAGAGVSSRRQAEELIIQGRVRVNGRTAELGQSADPGKDRVELDGERIALAVADYWVLHKPAGVVTTRRDPEGRATVMDLLPPAQRRLFPVGRLDRDSSGLLLLSNDGSLAQTLLHPSLGSEKEYQVNVKGELSQKEIERLTRGIRLEDGRTAPAKVEKLRFDPEKGTSQFQLTLCEGRNRQIRRMMQAVGHPVRKLVRVRIGPLSLGRLPRGKARRLRPEEVRALRAHAAQLEAKLRPSRR
jgi:23S rRNA pseudouridine2605 synthase